MIGGSHSAKIAGHGRGWWWRWRRKRRLADTGGALGLARRQPSPLEAEIRIFASFAADWEACCRLGLEKSAPQNEPIDGRGGGLQIATFLLIKGLQGLTSGWRRRLRLP